MSYYRKIVGKKCYLSPLSDSDVDNWSQWMGISRDNAGKMVKESQCNMDQRYTVVDLKTDNAIGLVSLSGINHLYRNCDIDILFPNRINLSDGYGVEAVKLLLDCAFNFLNINSVYLSLPATDIETIKCYEKAGFMVIGRRRESKLIDKELVDEVFLDILSNEYTSVYINRELERMVNYSL